MLYYRKSKVNSLDKDLLGIKKNIQTILYDIIDNKNNISALNTKINDNIASIKDVGKSNDEQEKNIGYLMKEVKTNINHFPTYNFDEYDEYSVDKSVILNIGGNSQILYKKFEFNYYSNCLISVNTNILIDYEGFSFIGYVSLVINILKHAKKIDEYEILLASAGDNSKEESLSCFIKNFLVSKSENDISDKNNSYIIQIYLKNIRTSFVKINVIKSNFEICRYKTLDINKR